jgi:nucleoside phosphorylase
MKTLFVAAVSGELGDLPGSPIGVGPVVAAARVAALLAYRPSRLVLVGTAGRYAGGPPVGAVIAAARLGWADGAAVAGLAYVPLPPGPIEADPAAVGLGHLPRASVLTVAAVTTDPALTARLGDGWEVEHLEAYAVALACREAGVPFGVVLGITNDVGPDAHAQWRANREEVQEAVRAAVRDLA